MDGLSVLYQSTQASPFYTIGNAHGWLSKSAKTAGAEYHLSGRLYLAKSGWLLLAVPNALVRGVFDAMSHAGAELPLAGTMNVPNADKELLNAHISVMTAEEVEKIGPNKINERGHSFRYSLGPVKEITPSGANISKVWAIQISSPELAALRKSYGLSALPNGDHPFHITVAIRKRNVLRENEISKFDTATGRGELKAAAADPATTILVSGHSGAGKSTLSKALAEKLKLPLYQVDSHPDQKAFFDVNKDGQETVVGSPAYEAFQKLRKRTAEETLAQVNGPAIVEGAQLAGLSPEQLAAYKTRIFVHTPLKQLLKQRLERQRNRQIAKGREWTPELAAKKQQIGQDVYDVQNQLMQQYAKLPDTLKYTTRKNTVDEIIAKLTAKAAADLLPGGSADNMTDSKFPKHELALGAADEHEHTDNDQIAKEIAKDHLQEDPRYYEKEKLIQKAAMPAIIRKLREAKEHSDNKRYDQKNQILKKLMADAPHEWVVDDPESYHMGITHAPTKFKFHADPLIIPPVVPVQSKAASNPYLKHLTQTPIKYDQNQSVWQNVMAHVRNVKARGDNQIALDNNTESWRDTLIPGHREQKYLAIARGQHPQQDLATQLIHARGDGVINALA